MTAVTSSSDPSELAGSLRDGSELLVTAVTPQVKQIRYTFVTLIPLKSWYYDLVTYQKYGIVAANVTEQTQGLWLEFKGLARSKGVSYTRALEQAARLWLDANREAVPGQTPAHETPRYAGLDLFGAPQKEEPEPIPAPVEWPATYVTPKENPFR